MINIIGGSARKIKADMKIIDEIRIQLATQMDRLGRANYFNQERIIEKRIDCCRRIVDEFKEELSYLDYQLDYLEIETGGAG
jgi:hypothetical protein